VPVTCSCVEDELRRDCPRGQREISVFPRYGGNLARDPVTPQSPSIEVSGVGIETAWLDAASLSRLPRREIVADSHCVAGWSARDLRWEGVRLRNLYELLEPGCDTERSARAWACEAMQTCP